jgi:hypothetical protein
MPISDDEDDEYKSEEMSANDTEISKLLIAVESFGSPDLNICRPTLLVRVSALSSKAVLQADDHVISI